ncbi:TRAP transporter small permease subunit [Ornithinibacillus sp. L9]|uniref:TRAP transporter small permease subunit n=1 Tax=Ornithinibacillus caprae TaxID=2678566 RepID=A0A6N8FDN9_9BACI|nr:TRAP transporter small permease [Ornithinibacillus caprae]MUK87640.1 TRAP transporter small permease subunit [Ornithinibacillus caprae]
MLSKIYKKMLAIVEFIIEHLATFLFILFFIAAILQVFFRFVLNAPLTWSEEAARYLNLWSVLLGAALAVKHRDHLRVDLVDNLVKKWPYRAQIGFYFFTTIISGLLVLSFLSGSIQMTIDRWNVPLTMLPLSQGVIYLALLVSSILMLWFFTHQLIHYIIDFIKNKGGEVE